MNGITRERRILKKRGARRHPMSGAGSIKWDGSTEDELIEVKDAARSFTMKGEYLAQLFRDAARQGKSATLLVRFGDSDLLATVTITPGIGGWEN